jgi:signal peptidase II
VSSRLVSAGVGSSESGGAAPSRLGRKLPWLAVAAGALTADLWTKHLVFYPEALDPALLGRPIGEVASWWRTVLAYNEGATFGLGESLGTWTLTIGVSVVIALLLRSLWKTAEHERTRLFALSIIIGGALGNLYDRALRPSLEADRHPGVRDFLDWYVPEGTALAEWLRAHDVPTHWYTFNVADALIVSGVVLLAWKILREKPEPEGAPA